MMSPYIVVAVKSNWFGWQETFKINLNEWFDASGEPTKFYIISVEMSLNFDWFVIV